MKIPLTWRYLLAFYCLGALMGMSHELAHHAAGFVICGDWGYKTFNFFELAKGCEEVHPNSFWLATLAGPALFNYLPLWIGVALMKKPDAGARLFGVSLVFSTVPILRIYSAFGYGDETWMVHHFFGNNATAFWIMKVCVLALTLPPLILAWKTIHNRYKPLVYCLFFIGVPITVFYVVGIVLEGLINKQHVLSDTVWGVPYMVLLAEALATIGYSSLKSHLWQPSASGPPAGRISIGVNPDMPRAPADN
ncbi:MAG: hypothetical protein ABJC63_05150 [Gemmatimonadales bacterium]